MNLTSATPKLPANEIAYRTIERQGKLKGAVKEHRMRAVGYVRVSTTKQAEEGVSLDAQRARIKAHCLSQGITLVDIITDDGESGGTLKRPGLQAALRMLATRKADAIVVLKLDRLTRSVKDLGHLCDTYFREGLPFYLLSVCDSIDTRSAAGKLILNVLDDEKISCRGPRWHKFSLSRVLRRAGYEDPERVRKSAPSKLEKALAESALIQRDKTAAATRAVSLRSQGLSLRQIGERLRGERILPPRSDAWHAPPCL